MEMTLEEVWSAYGRLYSHNVPLMRFHRELGVPLPRPFLATAEIVLNRYLLEAFRAPELDLQLIRSLLEEARLLEIGLEGAGLEYALRKAIERLAERFRQHPLDVEYLQQLEAAVTLETELPFAVHLWKVQNIYYEMLTSVYPQQRQQSDQGPGEARTWVEHFAALGTRLSVRLTKQGGVRVERTMTGFRVPAATYRLQFHHGFRFITAQALVPYLHDLGISDLYASPFFKARRRSLHGYSVTNPLEINPELGSRVSLRALSKSPEIQGYGPLAGHRPQPHGPEP